MFGCKHDLKSSAPARYLSLSTAFKLAAETVRTRHSVTELRGHIGVPDWIHTNDLRVICLRAFERTTGLSISACGMTD